ncbi:DUF551 domain-containing protein [Acinetobacter sp. YH12108]|uniref:DUF551 domain-containing protein n=1 Tax=Acinetobacter sp. YH12108 TaxID=2601095 RepID=UPI0015D13F56|nr:DUF551 domain-containing protein [Acinetobacter sp. YH12108]
MKIKEGGGMDIHKELLAYEQSLQDNGFFKVENIGMCTVFDPEQNKYHPSDLCDPKEYKFIDMLNVGWTAWQAAKARAVPEWISVKDNLPPENILVLGMSQTRSNIFNIYNVMALDEFEEAEVTHWMPLPDAPQEPAND